MERAKACPAKLNRDATVQRFETTFELSWKLYGSAQGLAGLMQKAINKLSGKAQKSVFLII